MHLGSWWRRPEPSTELRSFRKTRVFQIHIPNCHFIANKCCRRALTSARTERGRNFWWKGLAAIHFSLVNGSGWLQSVSLKFGTFFWSSNCIMENANFVFNSFKWRKCLGHGEYLQNSRRCSCHHVILYLHNNISLYHYRERNMGIASYS